MNDDLDALSMNAKALLAAGTPRSVGDGPLGLRSMSMPHMGVVGPRSNFLWSALVGGLASTLPAAVITQGTTVPGSHAIRLADLDLSTIVGWGTSASGARVPTKSAAPILEIISQAFSWMDITGASSSAIHAAVNNLATSGRGFIQDINGEYLRVAMRPIQGATWDDIFINSAALVHTAKKPLVRVTMRQPDGSLTECDPAQARHMTTSQPHAVHIYHPLDTADTRIYLSCRLEPAITLDEANAVLAVMRENGATINDLMSVRQIDDGLAWEAVFLKASIVERFRYDEASGALAVIIEEIRRIDQLAAIELKEAVSGATPLPDPWSSPVPLVFDVSGARPWKTGILLTTLCTHAMNSVGTTKLLAIEPSLLAVENPVIVAALVDVLRTARKRDIAVLVDVDAPGIAQIPIGNHPAIAEMIGGVVSEHEGQTLLVSGGESLDISACIAAEDVAAGNQLRLGYWTRQHRTNEH